MDANESRLYCSGIDYKGHISATLSVISSTRIDYIFPVDKTDYAKDGVSGGQAYSI